MFEKKYKIKNLHVVRLQLDRVKLDSNGKKKIYYFEKTYAIVKNYLHSDYIENEKCRDLFNNTLYSRSASYKTHMGCGTYYEYVCPLSKIFPTKEKVTKKELINLYNELNGLNKEETHEDEIDEVQEDSQDDNIVENHILKLILTTTDKINGLDLSNEKRTELLNQLKSIAEYYISKYITLKSENNNANIIQLGSPIAELEHECIDKIAEINLSLKEVEQNENLKKQLIMVKQKLN